MITVFYYYQKRLYAYVEKSDHIHFCPLSHSLCVDACVRKSKRHFFIHSQVRGEENTINLGGIHYNFSLCAYMVYFHLFCHSDYIRTCWNCFFIFKKNCWCIEVVSNTYRCCEVQKIYILKVNFLFFTSTSSLSSCHFSERKNLHIKKRKLKTC